ncbi:MAG: restriction endonuclease subunit S [Gemmatimonadales bacterium]|nr:restriction endonuclease subunit S [Gemmatimonadales bacterium]
MTCPSERGWVRVRLADVARIVTGKTPSPAISRYWGGAFPFVTPGDLSESIFHGQAARTLTDGGKAVARLVPKRSSLVTCIGSSVGKVAFTVSECTTNQQINAATARAGTDPLCLHYALEHASERISAMAGNTAVPLVTKGQLENFRVLLPPGPVQEGVGATLYTCDTGIALLGKLITAKRTFKRALMQDLLTGRRRFGGNEATTTHQATGHHPTGWRTVRISSIATACRARAGSQVLPVLSCTKHSGLVLSSTFFGKQVFSRNLSTYRVVRHGQFAYATNHLEEGSIGLLEDHDAGLVSPMYTVFEVTDPNVDPRYLFALLKSTPYIKLFRRATSGSVNRRGSLRWPAFKQIQVTLPPIEEQLRIVAAARAMEHELASLERQLEQYSILKRCMMQTLLAGEITIPDRIGTPD